MRRLVCVWAITALVLGSCRPPPPIAGVHAPSVAEVVPTPVVVPDSGARETVAIEDTGGAGKLTVIAGAANAAIKAADVTTMSEADTAALLARLSPMPATTAPPPASVRPPSAMPPKVKTVEPIAFVAPTGNAVADKPVVLRTALPPLTPPTFSPDGEVPAEGQIRVRFADAMVPVAELASAKIPAVTLTPAIAGTWRWIDTHVLVFQPTAPRFPGSTDIGITVPAGTKAVSGATLAADAHGTFATQPIAIADAFPRELRPDGVIAVLLDQEPDLDHFPLRVTTKAHHKVAFHVVDRAAAQAAWALDPSIAPTMSGAAGPRGSAPDNVLDHHHVLIAPDTAWPAGEHLEVTLDTGAGSAEGPRRTTRTTVAGVDIVPPFTVAGITCGYVEAPPRMTGAKCPADGYLSVVFSMPIEPSTFHPDKVRIEGEEVQDTNAGREVGLLVPDVIGHAYAIAIADDLRDTHAQALVGPHHPTFSTGSEVYWPSMWGESGLLVLDPRFTVPQWVLNTIAVTKLRVQLYHVEPSDYFAYEDYEYNRRSTPPGKRVFDQAYTIGKDRGGVLGVDLRPALTAAGVGHIVAIATTNEVAPDGHTIPSRAAAWIEVTKLGMTARVDGEHVNAWVTDVTPDHFLAPVANATTSLVVEGRTAAADPGTTDANGHATFDLWPRAGVQKRAMALVTAGGDSAFVGIYGYERAIREAQARWYVADDRFMYKPGEKVYLKGWVRWSDTGVNPDIRMPGVADPVTYKLVDRAGAKLAEGTLTMTDQGGFDAEVALPNNANLGTAFFVLETRGSVHRHPIQIQEFRTPAYAVSLNDDVTHAGAVPLVLGEKIEMTAEAHYYAGGSLAGSPISWEANLAAASYRPPNWDRFAFDAESGTNSDASATHGDALSGSSSASIAFGIAALPSNRPSILTVDATVADVDRNHIRASSRSILVHPSQYYVGVRQRSDDRGLDAIVTDIDGKPVVGVPIDIELDGTYYSEHDRGDASKTDEQHCTITSAAEPVACTWDHKWQYAYIAHAKVRDPRGRPNATRYAVPWWPHDDQVGFSIVPDQRSYRPGDVAKLELRSKIVPATAIVTFARQGVVAQKRVELTQASTIVELPIEAAYVEDIHVQADRIADRRHRSAGGVLPEVVSAEVDVPVELDGVRLQMTATATSPIVEPGTDATFEVTVKHDGEPVKNAEVALMVVDEAVLALSEGKHADPLPTFYAQLAAGTRQFSSFDLVRDDGGNIARTPGLETFDLRGRGYGVGMGGGGSGWGTIGSGHYGTIGHGSGSGAIVSREDFRANAVFSPQLHTDASGKVELTVRMPDNLTRFRIVALATANMRLFGKAEGTIVAQRKVNARTVAPRFLNQGDTFSLPVVVQNLDGKPRTVDVAVRAKNLAATGPSGKRVVVPAGGRAEVRFDFGTQQLGLAKIQTVIASDDRADATTIDLPVYAPATTEAFATYGVVDGDAPAFEQLAVPADVFADVGGVDVEVASTQLQSITDAYWYLYAYPYECAEQRSSRMLATSAVYDILDAFESPYRPTRAEIDAQGVADIAKLTKDQNRDGGWGYFPGMSTDPYVTAQVLTALALHKTKNASAIAYVTKRASELQARVDGAAVDDREVPYWISLEAATLSALAATGVDVDVRAARLDASAQKRASYPVDAKARLLAIVAGKARAKDMRARLLRELVSATEETASSATVTASYVEAERLLLVSSLKSSALTLDALIREQPDHPLIVKLARGVLDARKHGRWGSTQENLVALLALRRYFDAYEKATPDFTAKTWVGDVAYVEKAFHGHTGEIGQAHLDWHALAPGSTHDLAMIKAGTGRLYYRIGIGYAPKRADVPALDAGFVVRRSYTAIDDPADVTHTAAGYRIKLGARVRVTIQEVNTTKRYAVALVDPLPAGLESVNDALAVAERSEAAPDDTPWDFRNMRDDRSEGFSMALDEGTHQMTYTARATTPGVFRAAPAKAEEMYAPETFGRSTGETVVIE